MSPKRRTIMQSQKTLRKLLSLLLALTLLGGLLVPPVSAEAVITPKPLESAPAPEDAPGRLLSIRTFSDKRPASCRSVSGRL